MTDKSVDPGSVEDHDGILPCPGAGRDWNGIYYEQGMFAKNVGTQNYPLILPLFHPAVLRMLKNRPN